MACFTAGSEPDIRCRCWPSRAASCWAQDSAHKTHAPSAHHPGLQGVHHHLSDIDSESMRERERGQGAYTHSTRSKPGRQMSVDPEDSG